MKTVINPKTRKEIYVDSVRFKKLMKDFEYDEKAGELCIKDSKLRPVDEMTLDLQNINQALEDPKMSQRMLGKFIDNNRFETRYIFVLKGFKKNYKLYLQKLASYIESLRGRVSTSRELLKNSTTDDALDIMCANKVAAAVESLPPIDTTDEALYEDVKEPLEPKAASTPIQVKTEPKDISINIKPAKTTRTLKKVQAHITPSYDRGHKQRDDAPSPHPPSLQG